MANAASAVWYTVSIEDVWGEPAGNGTWVTFQFGEEEPEQRQVANGVAQFWRDEWFSGNWTATISAQLVPVVPLNQWTQETGGSNNSLEWVVE